MKLSKDSREALIWKFEKALSKKELKESLLRDKQEEQNQEMIDFISIELFCIEAEIDLIKESLINNEIDW